eukprot:9089580-Ditylum_brightwellii.AAC.3
MACSTKKGIAAPDPWKQFMTDIKVFLEEHSNKNEEIVLGMNVNEEDFPAAEIQQLACQLDLIDAHPQLHGNKRAPTTYKRGRHQLDFLFITPGILPLLISAGFLPFNIPFISDHCTIYADFDTNLLFNGVCNNSTDQSQQVLLSDNHKQREKYVELLSDYFKLHNIVERVKK